jgi:hypothetical protein
MNFFDKIFGRGEKKLIIFDSDLFPKGNNILERYGFTLTQSSDNGMWKYYQWTNSEFQFRLTYDRGYYDCDVATVNAAPDYRMSFIPLLKFLKNDRTFYNKELKEINLSRTLTPDGYIMLLDENYNLITKFFQDYVPSKFQEYKTFDFDYDCI